MNSMKLVPVNLQNFIDAATGRSGSPEKPAESSAGYTRSHPGEGQIIPPELSLNRPTDPNGKPFALSGDLNASKCAPEAFIAKRSLRTGAQPDCHYVDGKTFTVAPPLQNYKISNEIKKDGTENVSHRFPAGRGRQPMELPALRHNWTVNGYPISIYEPLNSPLADGTSLFPLSLIENGLRVLPAQQLQYISGIDLLPNHLGPRTLGQAFGSKPDFRELEIAFPPVEQEPDELEFMATMLHESAHIWMNGLIRYRNMDKLSETYAKKSSKDDTFPSGYAERGGENEDFAEFAVIYWTSKGTSCEPEARSKYPNRYAYFDLLAKLPVSHPPISLKPHSDVSSLPGKDRLPTIDQGQSSVAHYRKFSR
ncbi:hypothetical protein PQR02_13720 [Paraburkholderia sediminicola]|uniref:Uncharacterized protein n=1 Tax=Paraburkholderia rhynchosiae TaxID=487049 RepID=A0ACC7NKH1_9BURK